MVKESVIGPSRLPEGVSVSIVPGQIKQAFDLAISPEERAVGENEAAYDVARMVTKDFGYYLKVKLPKRCTHVLYREKLAPNYPHKHNKTGCFKGNSTIWSMIVSNVASNTTNKHGRRAEEPQFRRTYYLCGQF